MTGVWYPDCSVVSLVSSCARLRGWYYCIVLNAKKSHSAQQPLISFTTKNEILHANVKRHSEHSASHATDRFVFRLPSYFAAHFSKLRGTEYLPRSWQSPSYSRNTVWFTEHALEAVSWFEPCSLRSHYVCVDVTSRFTNLCFNGWQFLLAVFFPTNITMFLGCAGKRLLWKCYVVWIFIVWKRCLSSVLFVQNIKAFVI
jgi:hypothetical protein